MRWTMTPDVNVLVAASRSDHPHHKAALTWLEAALASAQSGAVVTVMPMVLASLLRLVTHPKIFKTPTPIADAVAFVDAVLSTPGVQLATLGPEWPILRQQCLHRQLSANELPDAWLAAAVEQLGEHLVSFDKDFKKLLGRGRFTQLQP
jgi:uncharacterized protein